VSDIPEDIQQAARDVVHDYPNIVRQCVPDIERALLRERERCAQIAETWPDAPFAKHGQWHGTLRKSIVVAIRTPSALKAPTP